MINYFPPRSRAEFAIGDVERVAVESNEERGVRWPPPRRGSRGGKELFRTTWFSECRASGSRNLLAACSLDRLPSVEATTTTMATRPMGDEPVGKVRGD